MPEGEFVEAHVEDDLRAALTAGALELHYQPIRSTDDLGLVAYESLMRWRHPVRGMVSPSDFIPIAERSSLIHDLGDWVTSRACRDLSTLGSRYVGVNVSAAQLRDTGFAGRFARILEREGVDAGQVTIEITETVPLNRGDTEYRNLHALRDLGCWLAVDDFGAGHASLDYLDKFPFNVLKIDKALVFATGSSAAADRVVESLCDLGRRRGVVVVAEGVETEAQLALLRRVGCSRAQGYLLGRPASAASWAVTTPNYAGSPRRG